MCCFEKFQAVRERMMQWTLYTRQRLTRLQVCIFSLRVWVLCETLFCCHFLLNHLKVKCRCTAPTLQWTRRHHQARRRHLVSGWDSSSTESMYKFPQLSPEIFFCGFQNTDANKSRIAWTCHGLSFLNLQRTPGSVLLLLFLFLALRLCFWRCWGQLSWICVLKPVSLIDPNHKLKHVSEKKDSIYHSKSSAMVQTLNGPRTPLYYRLGPEGSTIGKSFRSLEHAP
jgi:hypothetical protein